MDRDNIIRMAREAGLGDTGVRGAFIFFQPGTNGLERFAALVAAAEREACAKVCKDMDHNGVMIAADCATAIRARGEK